MGRNGKGALLETHSRTQALSEVGEDFRAAGDELEDVLKRRRGRLVRIRFILEEKEERTKNDQEKKKKRERNWEGKERPMQLVLGQDPR